jgi:ABC-type sugar transport system, periplasmic component
MKKVLSILFALALVIGLTSAVAEGLSGHLTVMTNSSGGTFDAMNAVIEAFVQENPGVTVEFTTQGSDYEQLMKAKMAANDLPDVFATHGWSVMRYKEYLLPLNDQSWFSRVSPEILPVISDSEGTIYTLPMNIDKSGIVYNYGILDKLGLSVPKTWEEFLSVCESVKEAGYTPVYIAGKDTGKIAGIINTLSATFLVSDEENNYRAALTDGTFDWQNFAPVAEFILSLRDKGYLNIDYLTADTISIPEKLAFGEVVFAIENNATMADAYVLNPEATLGIMPVPTAKSTDTPILLGGEREAYGVWKDGKNAELALALLDFMAGDEFVQAVSSASAMPASMTGVKSEIGIINDFYDQYTGLRVLPKFDRFYQPNGMWSTFKTVGSALLAGEIDVTAACDMMRDDYLKFTEQSN